MNSKKVLIILIIIAIVLITIAMVIIFNSNEEVEVNKSLNEAEMIALLKSVDLDLNKSETLQEGSITADSMARFALSYIRISGKYSYEIKDNEQVDVAIVQKDKLNEIVKHIFGQSLEFNNLTLEYDNDDVYIPVEYHGGDMQVYKLKSREYNEQENYYVTYIDCLETGFNRLAELADATITDYSEEDVMFTMVFKYKEQDGRRILLAYNAISNW